MTVTTIKERPILFRGDLVRKILDGSKTMTRRPVKPQPKIVKERFDFDPGDYMEPVEYKGVWFFRTQKVLRNQFGGTKQVVHGPIPCPYGQPGDRLWVRETWAYKDPPEYEYQEITANVIYKADGFNEHVHRGMKPWRPSIHMPRWASRILLEITRVRVERIRAIDVTDVAEEGFGDRHGRRDIEDFRDSWNATYPGSWDRNEWVWVIEFKRVQP